PFPVRARLEAPAVEVADPVDTVVEVDPAGNRRCLPARGGAEEVDVLPRHAEVQELRAQTCEPGASGPDDHVGLESLAPDDDPVVLGSGGPRDEANPALDGQLGRDPRR